MQAKQKEVSISKALSYMLRHDKNMKMDGEGWATISDVLKAGSMKKLNVTQADIEYVVNNSDKQRYTLKEEGGVWKVRANQGHSITVRG